MFTGNREEWKILCLAILVSYRLWRTPYRYDAGGVGTRQNM